MTIAIENVAGGTYTGSSSTPNSVVCGNINTSGANRLVVIVCVTGRANTGTDYNYPNGISASGLTFTNKIHQTFTYTDSVGGGSFPVASFSLDVFTAPAPTALTALAWNTTSMTGDGYVNDGVGYVFAISGLDPSAPYDTSGSLPIEASNSSGTSTAPALSGFTTSDTTDMLMTIAFNHGGGGGSPTVPTVTSGWTALAGSPVSSLNAGATKVETFIQTELQASPGTISITAPYADNFWLMEGLAFTAGGAPTPTAYGTVIN